MFWKVKMVSFEGDRGFSLSNIPIRERKAKVSKIRGRWRAVEEGRGTLSTAQGKVGNHALHSGVAVKQEESWRNKRSLTILRCRAWQRSAFHALLCRELRGIWIFFQGELSQAEALNMQPCYILLTLSWFVMQTWTSKCSVNVYNNKIPCHACLNTVDWKYYAYFVSICTICVLRHNQFYLLWK